MTLKKIKLDKRNYKVYFEFQEKHPKRTITYVTDPWTLEHLFENILHYQEMIDKKVEYLEKE